MMIDGEPDRAHRAARSVSLGRVVHPLFQQYAHLGGVRAFHVVWGRERSLEPLPSWALTPRPAGYVRFLSSVMVRRAFPWAALVWIAALIVVTAASAADAALRARTDARPPSAEAWLLAIGAAILFFVLPHDIQSDGRVRYYALAELIEWGDVSVVPYSLVGPLASAPLYFLGRMWMSPEWWCARFNTLVFLGGIVAMHRLMRGRADPKLARTFLLLLAAASMFPYHLAG